MRTYIKVDYAFNKLDSEKMIIDRQRNFFKVTSTLKLCSIKLGTLNCPTSSPQLSFVQVAIYFEPDQSVITKITKDAKMTWSDKISWVRKHKQNTDKQRRQSKQKRGNT